MWEEATRGNIFLDQEASKVGIVQRLLLFTRPGQVTTHWVACQCNVCWTWEWAFPAPQDTLTIKCPQTWSNMTMKRPCWLEVGPCQLPLQRLNHDLYKMLTFTTPWKEFRVETKNKALCALGKTQKNRPSDSEMFSGKDFYESKFLHLLIPRETLMSWTNVWT